MNQLDVDEAIGYVNKIIDNARCATCDRLEGSRLRYPCGHTACEHCVTYAEECQICTSPSQRSDPEPKADSPLTSSVKNATDLLKASQKLFNVNVFLHKRISEQRRIEKELFPKGVPPIKYENKRKSINLTFVNKENRYSNYLPGEAISLPFEDKMENSLSNVQQWLNKKENNFARKPFSDLNINTQQIIAPRNKPTKQNVGDENLPLGSTRKRSHFKTTDKDYSRLGGNRKSVNDYSSPRKKVKKDSYTSYLDTSSRNLQKCDNDESGIFMDNDLIIIDDSQESVIDKDKNAWLAVLKACENEELTSTSLVNSSQVNITNDSSEQVVKSDVLKINDSYVTKVPFYKRSAITETCRYCKDEVNSVPAVTPSKPVKITIDNENFLTTITVFNNVQNNIAMNTSSNVSVQTDNCKTNQVDKFTTNTNTDHSENKGNSETDVMKAVSECSSDKQSIDLFVDDRKIFGPEGQTPELGKCVVIDETDSDSDLDLSGPLSVKVDVHRSCQDIEYGILNEVHNMKEHEMKLRRGPRGHTPTSTDSSDKENYNPNRIKKNTAGKNFKSKAKFTKK